MKSPGRSRGPGRRHRVESFRPDAASVPERREVDPGTIHSRHELEDEERPDVDYLAPIVGHAERRGAPISTFECAPTTGSDHDRPGIE